jgi:hypothetical protein
MFEHLGANTSNCAPEFADERSFTRSLIRILENPVHAAMGISVLDIHRKLVNYAHRPESKVFLGTLLDDEGDKNPIKSRKTSLDRATMSSLIQPDPVYCHLSACPAKSKGGINGIILSRLDYPLEAFGYENFGEELEVDVHLRLRNNHPSIQRWKDWILDAPAEADKVSVNVVPFALADDT